MPALVHFEIPADDVERAKDFYERLFGWRIEKDPSMDYWMIEAEGDREVGGGMMKRRDPKQGITDYINVTSVDEYAGKVEELGGGVVVPRTVVPGYGYFAVCKDTEGNAFGIWESDEEAG